MSYNREQQGGKKYDGFNCTRNFNYLFWMCKIICEFLWIADQSKRKIGGYKDDRSWNFSFITCRISCVCADTSGEIVRKEKGQQQEEERCYRLYSHWQFSWYWSFQWENICITSPQSKKHLRIRCSIRSTIFQRKNFDYPEKTLKYKHIRRISDWFYYQFTTFNGLRLDMPEHLASMKQPNTNATHWRRGTSAITQFHIAPHWRRYLIPTVKQGTPLFFYPHVTQ